jgi:hypothetical protein
MSQLQGRWGPVATRAAGWLVILAWVALLGWWIHIGSVSEIITWIVLTLLGWWLLPRARRLWWRYGWHWPLPPAPPLGPPPSFRICCGRAYGGWISAPPQVAALALGPPRKGKTRGVLIPNVAAWEGPVLVTSTRRDVLDATCAWRARRGTVWLFDPLVTVDPLPEGVRRLVWSPLRGCSDWDTARGVEEASHWRTRATQLGAVLVHAAALDGRSLATVCAWAHAQRAEPAEAICQKTESQAAGAVLKGLLRTPDRERGSIWSALQGMLSPFDSTRVCQAAARWTPSGAQSFLTLAGAKVVLPGCADADTPQQLETLGGHHLVSLTTTTSRTKRHGQRHDDETESSSQSFLEQPRLPASAWRVGYRGSAWVLIGAGEPHQIRLIDPQCTQPFSSWLRPALEAPRPAGTATLPGQ